jgi:hypothetical protein
MDIALAAAIAPAAIALVAISASTAIGYCCCYYLQLWHRGISFLWWPWLQRKWSSVMINIIIIKEKTSIEH